MYVHNHMPMKALDGRTPYDAWYGVKSDVLHLCMFGAPCAIELKEHLKKTAQGCAIVLGTSIKAVTGFGTQNIGLWLSRKTLFSLRLATGHSPPADHAAHQCRQASHPTHSRVHH